MVDEIKLQQEQDPLARDRREVEKQKIPEVAQESEQGAEQERPVEQKEEVEPVAESAEVAQRTVDPSEPEKRIEKDAVLVDLEELLAQDLTDVFLQLPDEKKQLFKEAGEEIAQKVQQMIEKGQVKIGKILQWIRKWLAVIPGVNKHYIDQEAKIKADNIIEYVENQKNRLV